PVLPERPRLECHPNRLGAGSPVHWHGCAGLPFWGLEPALWLEADSDPGLWPDGCRFLVDDVAATWRFLLDGRFRIGCTGHWHWFVSAGVQYLGHESGAA